MYSPAPGEGSMKEECVCQGTLLSHSISTPQRTAEELKQIRKTMANQIANVSVPTFVRYELTSRMCQPITMSD